MIRLESITGFRLGAIVALGMTLSGCAINVPPLRPGPPLEPAPLTQPAAIDEAHRFLATQTAFDAFVAMSGEREITRWGQADLPINTHSVRKSILSALVGIAVERGLLRLDDTLAELGIDEPATPLTPVERSATVRQLLASRSGVYLQAAGETQAMKDGRPRRGQFAPGEHFYYNNWDFNVLGAIFEARTGLGIGQALHDWIAVPTGMRSFRPEHVIYREAERSRYRQFVIFMSAADLARFGALYAQQGRWKGQPVVPARWVEESLTPWSRVPGPAPFDGYGYLWWLDERTGTAWADGWRGQYLIVDRARGLAVVSRNDTGRNALSIGWAVAFGKDGFRDHHQRLWRLMREATARSAAPIDAAALSRMRAASGAPAAGAVRVPVRGEPMVRVEGLRELGLAGEVAPQDRWHLGSVAKSMTGTLVGRLVDRGQLRFDATLAELLPGLPMHEAYRPVTLLQLLQHRGGVVPLTQPSPELDAHLAQTPGDTRAKTEAAARWILAQAPVVAPGTGMAYSNGGYALVAHIVERTQGESLRALMRREVFEPLGMVTADFGWPSELSPPGPRGHVPGPQGLEPAPAAYRLPPHLDAAGHVAASLGDLGRYLQAHLAALQGDGGFLQPATARRLHQPAQPAADGSGYASGWRIGVLPSGETWHWHNGSAGTFYAEMALLPRHGLAAAVVTNAPPRPEQRPPAQGLLLRELLETSAAPAASTALHRRVEP